jgi:hypothetical protein
MEIAFAWKLPEIAADPAQVAIFKTGHGQWHDLSSDISFRWSRGHNLALSSGRDLEALLAAWEHKSVLEF